MEQIIEQIVEAANLYKKADQDLENVCSDLMDPIACTVYARKGIYKEQLPKESFTAAYYLEKVVELHGILVKDYHMDSDKVRSLWFPILNK
jgi:hypothetical protein